MDYRNLILWNHGWSATIVCLYIQEFSKNQIKYSVMPNWLCNVYNKDAVYIFLNKFCITHPFTSVKILIKLCTCRHPSIFSPQEQVGKPFPAQLDKAELTQKFTQLLYEQMEAPVTQLEGMKWKEGNEKETLRRHNQWNSVSSYFCGTMFCFTADHEEDKILRLSYILSSVLPITNALIVVWTDQGVQMQYLQSIVFLLLLHFCDNLLRNVEITCFPSWDGSRQSCSVGILSLAFSLAELFTWITLGNLILPLTIGKHNPSIIQKPKSWFSYWTWWNSPPSRGCDGIFYATHHRRAFL